MEKYREFLRANLWAEWQKLETDQRKQAPPPPPQKPYPEEAVLVDLVAPAYFTVGQMPLIEAIRRRRSRRRFTEEPLTLEELSFLLWATQGVVQTQSGPADVLWKGVATLRTVPSGGARHPFETYLVVRRVQGFAPGLYRYLPLEHKMCFIREYAQLAARLDDTWGSRGSLAGGAVVFIWTAIPYRTEWRYGTIAPKIITLDAGHVCQNLYLACEAIGVGTCAIAAYDQKKVDAIVGVDGREEFVVYLAPVGRVERDAGSQVAGREIGAT